ncbi:MAG: GntR family transcriptional regulator [bacterium]|nr:GntR family transcriptional regulator [bacterium]
MDPVLNKDDALYTQIYDILKNRIMRVEYYPGSFLTEASVAKELDTSRMPVRVAMRKLESEGWLIADFRKKIRVRDITVKDVREIYQLRKLLEVSALKEIFDTDSNWEYSFKFEECLVRLRSSVNDQYQWDFYETAFHREIVKALDSERIDRIYKNNQDELIRIGMLCDKQPAHYEVMHDSIEAFFHAVREKDFDKALDILNKDHIELGYQMGIDKIGEIERQRIKAR